MNLLEVFGLLFLSFLISSPGIYMSIKSLIDYKRSELTDFKLLDELKEIGFSMGYKEAIKENLEESIESLRSQIENLNKEIEEKKQEIKILNNGILFLKEFEQPIYNNLSADEVGKILYEFIEFVNEAKGYKIGIGTGLIYRFINEKIKDKR